MKELKQTLSILFCGKVLNVIDVMFGEYFNN